MKTRKNRKRDVDRVVKAVRKLLSHQLYDENGGWAVVDEKEKSDIYHVLHRILELRYAEDCDRSDSFALNVHFKADGSMPWVQPVPHWGRNVGKEPIEKKLERLMIAIDNVGSTMDRLETEGRVLRSELLVREKK